MSNCETCGREDGHWLGCAEAPSDYTRPIPSGDLSVLIEDPPQGADCCTFDGCSDPRRSADKRVKFCEFHSDPKNRK